MRAIKQILINFRALKISLSYKFVIGVAVVLTVAMGASLYIIDRNHSRLAVEQVDMQSKALFRQIVITRKWIADHGGIFVEKLPWEKPNPYLGEAEILDAKGKRYIRESPAMVTKELSRYARKEGLYWFHITSLKLVNPENAPDEFEKASLKAFETSGLKDSSTIEKIGDSYYYRYIAPLYIEEPCLKCHLRQGYKTGDVRGAISVTVPMDSAFKMIRSGREGMFFASVITISILMMALYIMMKELVLRPVNILKTSINDFSKGDKVRTASLVTGDELEDLSDSFVEMSKTLREYHDSLEDRVRQATISLEKANARLTEISEKKSDFIAQISHELRTPMTSIKGAMDYVSARISRISETDRNAAELMEFLDVIRHNADRLIRMVNDTLDLERIETGVFDLHVDEVDLLSLIKEVIISFQSVTGERNITFKIVAGPSALTAVDEDRIRQVLINLMSNAIDHSPDDCEIVISVAVSDSDVTVTIRDRGPGIPDELREKIFDKFYTIGKKRGTGLGLAICKGIIEAHDGEIGLLKGVQTGSALYFRLPKKRGDVS